MITLIFGDVRVEDALKQRQKEVDERHRAMAQEQVRDASDHSPANAKKPKD